MKLCPTCGSRVERIRPTPASRRVLDFILDFKRQHSGYPTVRQIVAGLGFRSAQIVGYHLHSLHDGGWIEIVRGPTGLVIRTARRAGS